VGRADDATVAVRMAPVEVERDERTERRSALRAVDEGPTVEGEKAFAPVRQRATVTMEVENFMMIRWMDGWDGCVCFLSVWILDPSKFGSNNVAS